MVTISIILIQNLNKYNECDNFGPPMAGHEHNKDRRRKFRRQKFSTILIIQLGLWNRGFADTLNVAPTNYKKR